MKVKLKLTNKTKRLIVSLISVAILGTGGAAYLNDDLANLLQSRQPGLYQVTAVNDGDTITVKASGNTETVRLIGIDTPELHHPEKPVQCFAVAARQFTVRLIADRPVRLEADWLDDNRDLYGRLLRYVYLPDGTLLNAAIVQQGYGFAYTHFPFTKLEQMRRLEREARAAKRGLWSGCTIEDSGRGFQTNPS
ncbi:thermonuclease family protein [Candidatus Microgenomates bacterium]|nr:thermonuclease family protein [Candidatus Microgenomates bacterium]